MNSFKVKPSYTFKVMKKPPEAIMERDQSYIYLDKDTDFSGEIEASRIILEGKINGTVRAKQGIHLKRGSLIEGEIYTENFFAEKGSVYHGKLHLEEVDGEKNGEQKKEMKKERVVINESGA